MCQLSWYAGAIEVAVEVEELYFANGKTIVLL
jgi:hypothetical protein